MNTGDVISRGDPYKWVSQSIKDAAGKKISTIRCAAVIDNIGKNDFDLFIFPSYSTSLKSDYPKIPVVIPPAGTVVSASIRVPTSPVAGESAIWGKHITTGCQILSNANDFLGLCWKTASGANLNSSVKISAASGVITKNSSIRINTNATIANILGATNTVDGVVSLKNLVAAGNALSTSLVRLSLNETALIIADLAVAFIDDPIQYEDVPGIGRREVFI